MKISLKDKEMCRIIKEKFGTLIFDGYEIETIEKRYAGDWEIIVTKIESDADVEKLN